MKVGSTQFLMEERQVIRNLQRLMSVSRYQNMHLGVLGGGQLGRMLIQEAINFDITVSTLDPDPDASCSRISNRFVQGSFKDYDTVLAFGKSVDLLTVEIEHVNVDALETLEKEGKNVSPSSRILRLVQDKGAQKIFYRTNGIPTAEFQLVANKLELQEKHGSYPIVQKLRKGGYDGRGVVVLRSETDLSKAFDEPCVLEKMVDFEKELSVIVARNSNGACIAYPAVEMEFNPEANLVEFLFSPANISPETEQKAGMLAMKVANALELTGILAVEMFLTRNGDLLVNEIAPRPHNSGHHTIEANVTSQYEQHLRAIAGLPLGSTQLLLPSVMVNLLGEKGFEGPAVYEGMNECLAMEGVHIHLYGKKTTKPFRKMGHVTICADTLDAAFHQARKVQKTLRVISK